jgi:hypothetical protein
LDPEQKLGRLRRSPSWQEVILCSAVLNLCLD